MPEDGLIERMPKSWQFDRIACQIGLDRTHASIMAFDRIACQIGPDRTHASIVAFDRIACQRWPNRNRGANRNFASWRMMACTRSMLKWFDLLGQV
jgi:hypothetical protein